MNTVLHVKLKRMLSSLALHCGLCGCPLSDDTIAELLRLYPSWELALYEACLLLAKDSSSRLPDGSQSPSQSSYWLRLALSARPTRTKTLTRADNRYV